jgi:hypothetical protein
MLHDLLLFAISKSGPDRVPQGFEMSGAWGLMGDTVSGPQRYA